MTFFRDFKYAVRNFAKQPMTTVTAIIALAIGISSITVGFGFLEGIMLSPLPYKDSERLAVLYALHPAENSGRTQLAMPLPFIDYIKGASALSSVCGIWKVPSELLVSDGNWHEILIGIAVTTDFFPTLDMKPQLGQSFSAEDEQPGTRHSVIITANLWKRRFNQDPKVIGTAIELDKVPHVIVGVMPEDFSFSIEMLGADSFARAWGIELKDPDLILPVNRSPAIAGDWTKGAFLAIARLKPGATIQNATDEVDRYMQQVIQKHRPEAVGAHAGTVSLFNSITSRAYPQLLLLIGTGILILLIVCANVSSLLVGRALERRKEFAVRASLGATHYRLVQQLAVEGIVLGLPACLLGILATAFVVRAVTASSLLKVPRIESVMMDTGVLAFAVVCALFLGIVGSLLPGAYSLRTDLQRTLNEGGKATSTSTGTKLQNVLVVLQIGLALAVLVSATLLTRTLIRINMVELGFDPDRVIVSKTIAFNKNEELKTRYDTVEKRLLAVQKIKSQIARLPGVEEVAVSNRIPIREFPWQTKSIIENAPNPAMLNYSVVGPDYLQLMRIPLLKGRLISEQDGADSVLVGVVNQIFVRQFARNGDPIGMRIKRIEKADPADTPWITVVGVVADSQVSTVGGAVEPMVYCSLPQVDFDYACLSIRVNANSSGSLTQEVRDILAFVDSDLQVSALQSYENVIKKQSAASQFVAIAGILFGFVVTLLAASGTYAVINQWASRRVHEIGIRIAVGARPVDIYALVLSRGVKMLLIGSILGVVFGLAGNIYITSRLYVFNLTARDWPSFVIAFVLLALITLTVCLVCARRSASVNPMDILRSN